ncbi:MAG: phosphoesterase, PA-phosphatase related protein [Pedosphaera sp.]|nr:phosphoesterase, PA-phosphatase related protein [Pedosphaera sp.]
MPGESSADCATGWRHRIPSVWRTKLALTAMLNVFFWGPYLFLSRHALLPVHSLPMMSVDKWAGFQPHPWAWIYESNFLLAGIVPWLITTREGLRRYALGFAMMAGVSFVIFALFPVASPRPANLESSPFLIFITRVDGPLNAFPSLHAGCVVYTLALVRRLFGQRLNYFVAAMLLVWAGLILFATLATKQHYAIDLLAGGLIGGVADWLAWRNSPPTDIASASTRRKIDATSQSGWR